MTGFTGYGNMSQSNDTNEYIHKACKETMRDSICHPMKECDRIEILVVKGINPRSGVEDVEKLRSDHLMLKGEVN